VNRAARAGGMGPDAARWRRLSTATERTGGRCAACGRGNCGPARGKRACHAERCYLPLLAPRAAAVPAVSTA
jgi:hypothetical protein